MSYLKSTPQKGVHLKRPTNLELKAYADASYGDEKARSQNGTLLLLGEQLVGWTSRRQDVVALSITEAEYISDCEGAKDLLWAKQFLEELGISQLTPPILLTDSEGAAYLTKTTKFQRRSRHIEHRFHYIRQQVKKGNLRVKTIPGTENLADPLTKLLTARKITDWMTRWTGGPQTI